jgi:hypothetical protein
MSRVIPGQRVRQRVLAVAAVVSAAVGLVLLTLWLWQQPQGANQANVLALPVGVISLLVAAGLGWWALRPRPTSPEVAGRLMKEVVAERQRFIDLALGVHWTTTAANVTFANPDAGSLPAAMGQLLVNWQELDGGRAGSIDDVSNFYRRETNGRLVVLGAPGSGKSVLLSQLVRDLAKGLLSTPEMDWPVSWRVPIMLSLPGCDLGETTGLTQPELAARFNKWIVERLIEDYQVPGAEATVLVSDQRILPVLDGLDEMDPAPGDDGSEQAHPPLRAAAVIQALNAERMPVVLACRDLEYKSLTVDAGDGEALGKPGLLTDARHVVLQPLPAQDVIDYLTDRFGNRTHALPNRWQPAADALKTHQPLLRVLENPWKLFLAVKAYETESSDPAELVNMTPDQANEQLLSALIPAVTDRDEVAAANGWSAAQVRHWLTSIADNQSRSSRQWRDSMTDIWLPELSHVAELPSGLGFRVRKSITPMIPMAATLLVALAFIVVSSRHGAGFVFVGVLLAFWAWAFMPEANSLRSPMLRFDLGKLRTSRGRRRYLFAVVFNMALMTAIGLVLALIYVLLSWLGSLFLESVVVPRVESVLFPAMLFGLAVGMTLIPIDELRGGLEIAPSPSVLAAQSIRYHTVIGLTVGLVFGVGTGLWCGQLLGLAPGLALGLATGLALGLGSTLLDGGWDWLWYAIGVHAAVQQHLLPRRPTRFLDWCLRTGLMRMSGSSLQFRHRQLQDWLTSSTERAAQAEWQARWRQRAAQD